MESQLHVVMVTVPCPGHIIPTAQVAKHLLSLNIRVSCFSTGMNYPSVEHNVEEQFQGQRIPFVPLIEESEFVSPGKDITDNISWMQAPSDGDMAARLHKLLHAMKPPAQCIISDLLAGWTQDVADAFRIPRHVLYTMPANALLFSVAVGLRVCGARGGAREADPGLGTAREDFSTRGSGRIHVALRMELHLGVALGREAHRRVAYCRGAETHCQVFGERSENSGGGAQGRGRHGGESGGGARHLGAHGRQGVAKQVSENATTGASGSRRRRPVEIQSENTRRQYCASRRVMRRCRI